MPQKEAIVEKAVENAHFQRNARGFLKKRNLCGCLDHRGLTVDKKNFQSNGFSGRKPPLSWKRSKPECAALTPSYEEKNSSGTKSPKQRK